MAINRDKVTAQAIKLLQAGKHEKAIAEFKKLVDDDPKDVRTLLKIGDTFVKMGRTQEAIESYERVATIYSDQGFYLKAVAVYKQMLRVDSSLPQVHLKLAEMYQQLNLSSDSLQHYQQVAVFYEQQGRTAETLNILKRMVDLDPDNLPSRIKLAELFAQQGMSSEAITEFRSAATYLRDQERYDDYIRVAERLIFFDPTALDITRELADVYMQRGEPKLALGKLQVCFKADPRNVDTLGKIADAFLRMDQVPKTVSVYKEMARIYGQTNRADEAAVYWKKVLEVLPTDEEASSALGLGTPNPNPAGQLTPSMVGPSVPSGAPVAEPAPVAPKAPAVDEKTEQIGRILTETDVYVKYGLRDKALDHLRRVFDLDQDHLEAHVKLREIQVALGNHDAAAEQLRVLVRLGEQTSDERTAEWRGEMNALNQPSGALPPPPGNQRPSSGEIVELREDDDLIVLEEDVISNEVIRDDVPSQTPAPMPIPDLPLAASPATPPPEPLSAASLPPLNAPEFEETAQRSTPAAISAFDDINNQDMLAGADLDAAAEAASVVLDGSKSLAELEEELGGSGEDDLLESDLLDNELLDNELLDNELLDSGLLDGAPVGAPPSGAAGPFGDPLSSTVVDPLEKSPDDLFDVPDDAILGAGAATAAPAESGELILGLNDVGDDFGAQLEAANAAYDDDDFPSTDAALDEEARLAAEEMLAGEFGEGFDSQFDQAPEPASDLDQHPELQPAADAVPLEGADLAELEDALSSADADRLVKAALEGIDDAFGDAGLEAGLGATLDGDAGSGEAGSHGLESEFPDPDLAGSVDSSSQSGESASRFGLDDPLDSDPLDSDPLASDLLDSDALASDPLASVLDGGPDPLSPVSELEDLPLSQLQSMTADAVLQESEFGDVSSQTGAPLADAPPDLDETARMNAPSVVSAEPDDPFGAVIPDGFGLGEGDDASYASTEIMSLSPDELAEIRAFADAAEERDAAGNSAPLGDGLGDVGLGDEAGLNAGGFPAGDIVGAPLVQQPPNSELGSVANGDDGSSVPFGEFAKSEADGQAGFDEATVAMQLPLDDMSKLKPSEASNGAFDDPLSLDAVAAAAADEFTNESTSAKTPRLGLSEQAHGFESDPATQFYPDEMEEAEFFIQQDLLDEAREILTEIHEELEDSERVVWMLARVSARENDEPEPPAPWEAALEESLAEEIGDLGDLLDDVLPSAQDLQVSVDEVLSQFKKGVAETVDEDDAETHYNLGIAYREMGLAKDAISEFDLAARAPTKAADSLHLIGLCHFDIGEHQKALDAFTRALLSDYATEGQQAVNEYQRGVVLMEMGLAGEAVTAFESAKEHGAEQGDLDERLAAAAAAAPLNGTSPLVGDEPPRRNKNIDYV